eukprot:15365498-Ditylum_brightwellii.AAC.1
MGLLGRVRSIGKKGKNDDNELTPPIIKSSSVGSRSEFPRPRRVSLKKQLPSDIRVPQAEVNRGSSVENGRSSGRSSISSTRESIVRRMSVSAMALHGLTEDMSDDESSVASENIILDAFTKTMCMESHHSSLLLE